MIIKERVVLLKNKFKSFTASERRDVSRITKEIKTKPHRGDMLI